LIAAADLALVSSGTATLECALLERPMVIVYRLGPLSYGLGRLLVRGVSWIGMPNIVAGREVVPELLQRQATGPRIAAAALPLLAKYAFDYVFDHVLDPAALRHMSWQQLQQLITISPEQLQHLRGALPYAVVGVLVAAFARGGFDFGASYLTDWIGQRVMTD